MSAAHTMVPYIKAAAATPRPGPDMANKARNEKIWSEIIQTHIQIQKNKVFKIQMVVIEQHVNLRLNGKIKINTS